ncbi:MAG: hypothetical protein AAFU81_05250 [Pseudomonadota bacterium]
MFSVMTDSPNTIERRGWFERYGKLVAISAIMLSASAAMSFAGQYPVSTIVTQSASIDRPCNQLELSAQMAPSECGTLTLADVVARVNALEDDDRDG